MGQYNHGLFYRNNIKYTSIAAGMLTLGLIFVIATYSITQLAIVIKGNHYSIKYDVVDILTDKLSITLGNF